MSTNDHQDNDITNEVQQVLEQESQGVPLEDVPNEQSSPLNEAVKEKDIAGNSTSSDSDNPILNDTEEGTPLDAPEQEIGNDASFVYESSEQQNFEMPKSAAEMAAEALLGSVNNYIGVGAGFFIRIRKHKDFYEFEEVIRIVDEQNEKNIQRIRFDEEDLALLKPLLIQVIQKRAKKLTPEQQLLSVLLSIIVKKAQAVIQIRTENELLIDRILDIIREEKGASGDQPAQSGETVDEEALEEESDLVQTHQKEDNLQPTFEAQVFEVSTEEESTSDKG